MVSPNSTLSLSALGLCFFLLSVCVCDDSCSVSLVKSRDGFVLDTAGSVRAGAVYLSSPHGDCARACCESARCNAAVLRSTAEEEGGEEEEGARCFLFDCLHRDKFICRFVRKEGFTNHILKSVYQGYLRAASEFDEDDRSPKANAGPDVVVRPGTHVMLNGSESWDDKKIISYVWTQLGGNRTVVTEKTELPDQVLLSNLQSGVYKFQLTVTDSSDQSDSASVTVQVLTAEQSELYCLSPKKVGPCRASFLRWYYNATTSQCEEFIFGGCKANENNYVSYQECFDACDGTSVTPGARRIKLPGEVCGQRCEEDQFTCSSDCCLQEGLVCDGEVQCSNGSDEKNCQQLNRTLAQLLEIKVNEEIARCVDPPVTGPCRASMKRWYYNPVSRDCHRFTYGGCSGNKNNFENEKSCMEACKDVTEDDMFMEGLFDVSDHEKHRSGSAATAVILSVVALVLLALLGYCFLKKRKKASQRQRVPPASPQVPFTEDTEHLVYKPTTTP